MRIVAMLLVALASFASNATQFTLPFELCKDRNAMLVAIEVNGKPAHLLLDTGSEFTILSTASAGITDVELKKTSFGNGPGMSGDAIWGIADIRLPGLMLDQQRVVVMNLEQVRRIYGKNVDGLLGQDILGQF
ncbi:MAG TPA: retropepsin-like aspartic protease, partial [Terriglobales bacterium]